MKYCTYCKVLNEEGSMVCKICGRKLNETVYTKESKVKYKPKTKHKTKHKTKYKKVYKDRREKGKMSFFQKFMMFILINLCIALMGVCAYMGYHIYTSENIDVPNVIGYTFEEGESILKENKLEVLKVDKKVSSHEEVGIILDQSKKGKAKENQTVKLYVGVLDDKIIVPSVIDLDIDKAIEKLKSLDISYKLEYEEGDKDGIVTHQSIKEGSKIEKKDVITLKVSKKQSKTEDEITKDEVGN